MISKHFTLLFTLVVSLNFAKAQHTKNDSAELVTTFKTLLTICKNVDFANLKTREEGMFYKAAPFIIYRGNDKKRAWKDFANYQNAEEKKGVDAVCTRINESVNRDSAYEIQKYFTEKEGEGVWHVLLVSYKKNGIKKKSAFAFLKVGKRFGLGDID